MITLPIDKSLFKNERSRNSPLLEMGNTHSIDSYTCTLSTPSTMPGEKTHMPLETPHVDTDIPTPTLRHKLMSKDSQYRAMQQMCLTNLPYFRKLVHSEIALRIEMSGVTPSEKDAKALRTQVWDEMLEALYPEWPAIKCEMVEARRMRLEKKVMRKAEKREIEREDRREDEKEDWKFEKREHEAEDWSSLLMEITSAEEMIQRQAWE
ncbi:hypothetical protein DFH27DRAFT_385791 [Peziza echinospora]|nr:hypothetical protein DFH27DRAFT_385791 [Peziza echinospora]